MHTLFVELQIVPQKSDACPNALAVHTVLFSVECQLLSESTCIKQLSFFFTLLSWHRYYLPTWLKTLEDACACTCTILHTCIPHSHLVLSVPSLNQNTFPLLFLAFKSSHLHLQHVFSKISPIVLNAVYYR